MFASVIDAIAARIPRQNPIAPFIARFRRRQFSSFPWKKYVPVLLLVVIVAGIIAIVTGILPSKAATDARIVLRGPLATVSLNSEFSFPLKDADGKEVSRFKYIIETAELRDEIIVKGSRMVAIKGRVFLILTIKLTNDYSRALEINVRDYVRLVRAGNEQELLAADIHSDPVSIQAISTKYTRIGFPIYDTDRNVTLFIGEINGDKERVPLQF